MFVFDLLCLETTSMSLFYITIHCHSRRIDTARCLRFALYLIVSAYAKGPDYLIHACGAPYTDPFSTSRKEHSPTATLHMVRKHNKWRAHNGFEIFEIEFKMKVSNVLLNPIRIFLKHSISA